MVEDSNFMSDNAIQLVSNQMKKTSPSLPSPKHS